MTQERFRAEASNLFERNDVTAIKALIHESYEWLIKRPNRDLYDETLEAEQLLKATLQFKRDPVNDSPNR